MATRTKQTLAERMIEAEKRLEHIRVMNAARQRRYLERQRAARAERVEERIYEVQPC
jgi:hypothetical protein